ncbi:hypothetical protein SprV_0902727800 [Sparganum proliferum]
MTFFRFWRESECLSDEELMAAHKLTHIQLNELREIFNCFDADGNGSISKEEFTKILDLSCQNYSPVQMKLIMSKVDINGDGQIGFDEFVEAFSSEHLTSPPDASTLRQTFDVFDRDHDGFITAAELLEVLQKMNFQITYAEAAEMLSEADKDGDGRVTFDEFSTIMTEPLTEKKPDEQS